MVSGQAYPGGASIIWVQDRVDVLPAKLVSSLPTL
jgi:hypothetical protein